MRPDTECSDALWSLGRVTPTPSRLPQARIASLAEAIVSRLGPLSPPDSFPAHAGPPSGHRQAHHTPQRPPPAACHVSASACALPSPSQRWRTPARDHAGAHEPLPAGGTPLGMGLPPLRTHGLPVQGWLWLHRRWPKRRAADGEGLGVRLMI